MSSGWELWRGECGEHLPSDEEAFWGPFLKSQTLGTGHYPPAFVNAQLHACFNVVSSQKGRVKAFVAKTEPWALRTSRRSHFLPVVVLFSF